MHKFVTAALCTLPFLYAAAPQTNPPISGKEMVRRALDAYAHDDGAQRQYEYRQRQDVRLLDDSGKIKHRDLRTFQMTQIDGSPYKRLLLRNDQPLPPDEEKQQATSFVQNVTERRGENPEQRRQRIAEWERKRQERLGDMHEVPNAFDFRVVGENSLGGIPVWIVEGTPRPGYKPHCKSAAYFSKLKGRIWITKNDYRAVKIDAETLDTISIGAFLIRIAQGGRMTVDFSRIAANTWMPSHANITGSARIFLIKGYRLDADYSFSDYKQIAPAVVVASN